MSLMISAESNLGTWGSILRVWAFYSITAFISTFHMSLNYLKLLSLALYLLLHEASRLLLTLKLTDNGFAVIQYLIAINIELNIRLRVVMV